MSLKLSQKTVRPSKNQQDGSMRFYIQDELYKARIIKNLKLNLYGQAGGEDYRHRATGDLEKSIRPAQDKKPARGVGGDSLWTGKNLKVDLITDKYLGLAIGQNEVSVRVLMNEYGWKISEGFKGANYSDIVQWIMVKARRFPTSGWYIWNGTKPYYYYGEGVTQKVAEVIARPVTKRLDEEGYQGSRWTAVLNGKDGLDGALQRARTRFLMKYEEWAYIAVDMKLDKMLSKL
jgi:hypothetical protein